MSLENGGGKAQTGGPWAGRAGFQACALIWTGEAIALARSALPANVRLGQDSRISGPDAFKRYFSRRDIGLSLGERSWTDGAKFAIGPDGFVTIGRDCYLNDCVLLAEQEIRIGDHVMIGWNTTLSDSDFHPVAPAERIQDAIAVASRQWHAASQHSPQGGDHRR